MNILIVRTGGLGDSILTLHCAEYLKKRNPHVRVHVLGNATMLCVSQLSGITESVRLVDESVFACLFSEANPRLSLWTYFAEFSQVYFYTVAPRDAVCRTLETCGVRCCSVLDPRPPCTWGGHITEHLAAIFKSFPFPDNWLTLYDGIFLTKIESKEFGFLLHPGSGSIEKNWPLENYFRVADAVDVPVTFIAGPAEIERGTAERIAQAGFKVICPESIAELSAFLSHARAFLGNDSGTSHLSALHGIPTIVLFGPTDPVIWRPLGKHVRVIQAHDGVMKSITVAKVVKAVQEMLKEDFPASRAISASERFR